MQRSYFIYVVVLLLLTVLRTATAKAVKSDNELVAERLLAQVAPTNATAAVITAAQDLHSQLANGSWADIDYKRCESIKQGEKNTADRFLHSADAHTATPRTPQLRIACHPLV